MLNNDEYKIGTIVQLKKSHPSGTIDWEVVRLGIDIKLHSTIEKTLYIILPRKSFNSKVTKIVKY